jgi:hypothetical protein
MILRQNDEPRPRLRRVFGAIAVTALLAAAFSGQAAYASAGQPSAPSKATTQAATPKPAKTAVSAPKTQVPTKQQRAAAGKSAFVHADVADTCSGAIQPGIVYSCASFAVGATNTYTLPISHVSDQLMFAITTTDGQPLQAAVTAPDSTTLSCSQPVSAGPYQCTTGPVGTYTLQLSGAWGPESYTISYLPILSDASCTAVTSADLAFDVPARHGSLAAGEVGDCFSLNQPSGTVVRSMTSWDIQSLIYDATGTQVCSTAGACTLTGTAPYKVLINEMHGSSNEYDWRLTSLSNPTGCVAATPQPFNTIPAATSAATCRALTVTTAGVYRLGVVDTDPQVGTLYGTVYDASGSVICADQSPTCVLPAGVSYYVLDAAISASADLAIVFRGVTDSRGCTTANDTGFANGPATGALAGNGEEDCLILPTAAGKSLSMLNGRSSTAGGSPYVQVYDSVGALVCDNHDYGYQNCKLAGTAPFHAILSGFTGAGDYQILVQRTDSTAGCTAWPQSGFGGTYGVQATLTTALGAACLSIPAAQHSTGEMIDYANTANTVNATVTVIDANGVQSCVGATTAICSMTSGVAYTGLLIGNPDTFQLVRRDVSSTATCSAPTSTTPGGASTAETFTSSLDARCIRVTAAAGDKLLMGVRPPNARGPGAVIEVANNAGAILCRQSGIPCRVTGFTSYQVIVIASNYAGTPIPASVDTWRVGTPTGWAPECTAHPLSMDGFAPVNMSVTESLTGYCGVVNVQPSKSLGVYGGTSAPSADIPWVSMITAANWPAEGGDYCGNVNYLDLAFMCQVQSDQPAAQAVLIVYPYEAPVPFTMAFQGVCYDGCTAQPPTPTVTSVSPATGRTETTGQLVVHGTGLNMGDKVTLTTGGSPANYQEMATSISASADGTTLTVQLFLGNVAPGLWDVTVTSPKSATVTLPNAYTVTAAAPAISGDVFVPVPAKRILDTSTGLGAAKAKVGAGGVVKLTVAGVGGIPSTGVTAVVLNVTASSPTATTYVTAYADGTTFPHTANLNVVTSQTLAVLTTVAAPNGKVDLRNNAGTVNLQADVIGYYTATGTGSALTTLRPTRILDTRSGVGSPKAKIGAGGTAHLTVAGVGGIPSTGVTAVMLNVTATNATATSHVTVYPDGQAVPAISNLLFVKGRNASDLVIVPVVNGKVDLRNYAGSVDLLADVTGYFTAAGSGYHSATPVRIMDTRSGLGVRKGAIPASGTVTLTVAGVGGIPQTGVSAVLLSVTVIGPTVASGLTAYADGTTVPSVPSMYFGTSQSINNLVMVPVVNGKIDFKNTSGNVQVVVDVSGYYTS